MFPVKYHHLVLCVYCLYPQNALLQSNNESFTNSTEADDTYVNITDRSSTSEIEWIGYDANSTKPYNTSENTNSSEQSPYQRWNSDINCSKCQKRDDMQKHREEQRQRRLEDIKKEILAKLKLSRPPKLSGPVMNLTVPNILEDFKREQAADETYRAGNDFYAKMREIYVFGKDVTRRCGHRRAAGCIRFSLRKTLPPEEFQSAELWLYKVRDPGDVNSQSFAIFELEPAGRKKKKESRKLVSVTDMKVKTGWIKFDLTKTVLRWLKKPGRNNGVVVDCKTCQKEFWPIQIDNDHLPLLVLHKRDDRNRKKRQSAGQCSEHYRSCCMERFYVDFALVNWTWIMMPRGYYANYCIGNCNVITRPVLPHTYYMENYREHPNSQDMSHIQPCCAPIVLDGMSMLVYGEDGNVVKMDVPNMRVSECGCA